MVSDFSRPDMANISKLLHFWGYTEAPLEKVPWVPGNPSILGQWIPEPINFRKKQPKWAQISLENEQEIGNGNFEYVWEPTNLNS